MDTPERDGAQADAESSGATLGDGTVAVLPARPDPPDPVVPSRIIRSIRRFWRRRAVRRARRVLLVVLLLFLVVVGTSITEALTAPGTDTTSVRLAEWGRDHGLGGVIDWLEKQQYEHNQPAIGGTPAGGIPPAAGALAPPATGGTKSPPTLPAPPAIPVLAGGAPLPGEGQWQTVVTIEGAPAVRVAALRPTISTRRS